MKMPIDGCNGYCILFVHIFVHHAFVSSEYLFKFAMVVRLCFCSAGSHNETIGHFANNNISQRALDLDLHQQCHSGVFPFSVDINNY